jgi:hypothetical protein
MRPATRPGDPYRLLAERHLTAARAAVRPEAMHKEETTDQPRVTFSLAA